MTETLPIKDAVLKWRGLAAHDSKGGVTEVHTKPYQPYVRRPMQHQGSKWRPGGVPRDIAALADEVGAHA